MRKTDPPKALLFYPPIYDFALYDLFLKPYGLLKLGRRLEEGGWEVRLVNALDYEDPPSLELLGRPKRRSDGTGKMFRLPVPPPEGLKACGRRFSRYGVVRDSLRRRIAEAFGAGGRPDIILVSTGMTYWYPGVAEALRLCREIHPSSPVMLGGVYATLLPAHAAEATEADFVVSGDGREEFDGILRRLGLPVPVGPASGPPLFLPEVWKDAGVLRLNAGCPLDCDYCASRRLHPVFAAGDPEASFRELVDLMNTCRTRNFAFYDDALLVGKEKVFLPFLERVIDRFGPEGAPDRRGPDFFLPNAVHIRHIDEKTARLMYRAGFREIRMGFESSSPDFHARHDDKFRLGSFSSAIETLREAGFSREALSVYVLAGLPGQRAEEVEESLRFVGGRGVRARLSEYSPVPGSALWEESVRLCRYPLEEEPLYHNNTFFPMEWEGFSRKDLERLKALARGFSS